MATPAGVGSPEQQALMALQTELQQSRGQVLALTQRFDALAAAHQSLNSEADRLFREKSDQIAALEGRLSQTLNKQTFDLLDLKSMKPEKFQRTSRRGLETLGAQVQSLLQRQSRWLPLRTGVG
jgi:hypothetical protein